MIPTGPHNDWPWPFSLISRRLNILPWSRPPIKILGNAKGNLDILAPGEWAIAGLGFLPIPVCFVFRTKPLSRFQGRTFYLRLALARFDYNGRYYSIFSFARRLYE